MKKNNRLKINRDYVVRISIEMFSVVFAIFLALLIDEWRENKTNQRLADNAYSNIKIELINNHESLTSMLCTHDSVLTVLDSVIQRIENNDTSFSFTLNGVSFESISDAAWEATKYTSAINYMNFNDIMKISPVYDCQKLYRKLMDDFFNDNMIEFSQMNREDEYELLYTFTAYLRRFNGLCHQLDKIYEEVLTELNSCK